MNISVHVYVDISRLIVPRQPCLASTAYVQLSDHQLMPPRSASNALDARYENLGTVDSRVTGQSTTSAIYPSQLNPVITLGIPIAGSTP